MLPSGRSAASSHVDSEVIDQLIAHNGLTQLGMSKAMYGGNCPFCGAERCFTLWALTGAFRCFQCGCDGRFVRTPERSFAKKEAERKRLMAIHNAAWE
jgi:hypothetical protein